jgi:hypothetical protein
MKEKEKGEEEIGKLERGKGKREVRKGEREVRRLKGEKGIGTEVGMTLLQGASESIKTGRGM